jgi:hypothetical protein
MDDLGLLGELRADVGSNAASIAVVRERLVAAIESAPNRRRHAPRRRLRVATFVAVAVAAVGAVVIAVLGRSTTSTPPSPVNVDLAAKVLRAAALSAASQPTVRPRPGQWIYSRTVWDQPGSRTTSADNWVTFDGRSDAYRWGGRLLVHRAPAVVHAGPFPSDGAGIALRRYMHEVTPMSAYDALASLPVRPEAMLAAIRRAAAADPGLVIPPGGSPTAHTTIHQLEFEFFANLLWNAAQAAPAPAEAAAFRALSTIHGVTAIPARDAAGRLAVALSERGVQSQLLLDRRTYQVTGLRMISNGHWPMAPKSNRTIPAGTVVESLAWVRIAFVARPGER